MSYTSTTIPTPIGVQLGLHVDEPGLDRPKLPLDCGQTSGDDVGGQCDGVGDVRWRVAGEHCVQVAWVPAEGDRKSLESACAAAALGGVAVQLADDRLRDVRAGRQV